DRTAYSSRVAETDGIALTLSPTAYPLLRLMNVFGPINLVSLHEYQRVQVRLPGRDEASLYLRGRRENPLFVWLEFGTDVRQWRGGVAWAGGTAGHGAGGSAGGIGVGGRRQDLAEAAQQPEQRLRVGRLDPVQVEARLPAAAAVLVRPVPGDGDQQRP